MPHDFNSSHFQLVGWDGLWKIGWAFSPQRTDERFNSSNIESWRLLGWMPLRPMNKRLPGGDVAPSRQQRKNPKPVQLPTHQLPNAQIIIYPLPRHHRVHIDPSSLPPPPHPSSGSPLPQKAIGSEDPNRSGSSEISSAKAIGQPFAARPAQP